MSKHDDRDYAVGFGKPPKHSRFKKGQSGNPKGRPKASKNVDKMLRDTLLRMVTISENGKKRKITALEAFFRQTLKGALEGDARAADKLLKLLPTLQNALEREDEEEAEAARDDRPVLAALATLMGAGAGDLFLANQEEVSDAE